MVHTWIHFHFNDLTNKYIEWRSESTKSHRTSSVMDHIIRCHFYYTTVLNAAGHSDGCGQPQMRRWSLCTFLCAPWKAVPLPTQVMREVFASDVTGFWFKDQYRGFSEDQTNKAVASEVAGTPEIVMNASNVAQSQSTATAQRKQNTHYRAISSRSVPSVHSIDFEVTVDPQSKRLVASTKVADPGCFPPNFVRNRLRMFEHEFAARKQWVEMHRGYSIYKDCIADYYQVIHEQFTVKLHEKGYLKNKDLERYVHFVEEEGYPGLSACRRDGGYLHIFSTLIWLNVVHSSDHKVATNMARDFGITASVVPMHSEQWYREHAEYDFVDVVEGKDCWSRWRLQFYALRNQLFWTIFVSPWNERGFHADHMIDSHLLRHFVDIDGIAETERIELDAIHKEYIRRMKQCDTRYRWLAKVELFSAGIHYKINYIPSHFDD